MGLTLTKSKKNVKKKLKTFKQKLHALHGNAFVTAHTYIYSLVV